MYRQANKLLYFPFLVQIPMSSFYFEVNYTELLDSSAVEFSHNHCDYEIYYALEGISRIRVNSRIVALSPKRFLLIAPGVQHGSIYEPNVQKQYFVMVFNYHERISTHKQDSSQFEKEFMDSIFDTLKKREYFVAADQNQFGGLIPKIQEEIQYKSLGWQLMMRNYYFEFIINAFRNIIPPAPVSAEKEQVHLTMAIEITKFMHAHYNESITLTDVANALHVTPRHISRLFEKYFGTSFGKTLSIYRLNYAKNYLCDTDYSIEKIAQLVGFSSAQTLFKLFKEWEELSISQYRVLHQFKGTSDKRSEYRLPQ